MKPDAPLNHEATLTSDFTCSNFSTLVEEWFADM